MGFLVISRCFYTVRGTAYSKVRLNGQHLDTWAALGVSGYMVLLQFTGNFLK